MVFCDNRYDYPYGRSLARPITPSNFLSFERHDRLVLMSDVLLVANKWEAEGFVESRPTKEHKKAGR